MTFTDAAHEVLLQTGRPLHYKEITELAIESNLLSHVGKSPEVTMGARLAATLKKEGENNPLIRVKPGVFALRDWDEETIKQGLQIKRAPRKKVTKKKVATKVEAKVEAVATAATEAPSEETSEEQEAAAPKPARRRSRKKAIAKKEASTVDAAPQVPNVSTTVDVAVAKAPQSPDEAMRAQIAASAAKVFAAEDDDDRPILAEDEPQSEQNGEAPDGRRRRRRRRRRGSRAGGDQPQPQTSEGAMPSYTATSAFDEGASAPRGPQVIELSQTEIPNLDSLAGRELADGVAAILSSFDRTVGAVSLRQIVETAQRRGKLNMEGQLAQSQIAAAVRADNARRDMLGMRQRFRLAGGRVGLTDWLLDGDLARCERDLSVALKRYREAARRAFTRKCAELPGHAFVELCLMLLERIGTCDIQQVKFPGASSGEVHLSGMLHLPAGIVPGRSAVGDALRLAIIIRKDGRDLGRERVTELRGSAHHYGSATMGFLMTSGQVLSGAREESGATGVMPVSLLDGSAIALLCGEHGVAVKRTNNPVSLPNVDLFEALRSS